MKVIPPLRAPGDALGLGDPRPRTLQAVKVALIVASEPHHQGVGPGEMLTPRNSATWRRATSRRDSVAPRPAGAGEGKHV